MKEPLPNPDEKNRLVKETAEISKEKRKRMGLEKIGRYSIPIAMGLWSLVFGLRLLDYRPSKNFEGYSIVHESHAYTVRETEGFTIKAYSRGDWAGEVYERYRKEDFWERGIAYTDIADKKTRVLDGKVDKIRKTTGILKLGENSVLHRFKDYKGNEKTFHEADKTFAKLKKPFHKRYLERRAKQTQP